MPRRKSIYRAALTEAGEYTRGAGRPLDIPHGTPATIEVGMGAGHLLVARAAVERDRFFVGLEIKEERTFQAVREARLVGLTNIRFVVGEVARVDSVIPRARFDELLVLFPDPWPANGDHKRRLISPRYLAIFARWLVPGARCTFRTDNLPLFEYATTAIQTAPFRITQATRAIAPKDVETRYEKRFRAEGIPIHEVVFERLA